MKLRPKKKLQSNSEKTAATKDPIGKNVNPRLIELAGRLGSKEPDPQAETDSKFRPVIPVNPEGLDEIAQSLLQAQSQERKSQLGVQPTTRVLPLCETFRRQAFWTWDQLSKARSVNTRLGEESLTDFNLLEIKLRHGQEVITRTFTKREESTVGADWEWWLTGANNQWIGFRLQAKTLDFHSGRYEHLHYITNSGQYQCDLLCDRARRTHPRCIPLYCLYSHWEIMAPIQWRCGSFLATPESYGCSLVDAFYIQAVKDQARSNELRNLLPKMVPWHCLVCCEGYTDGDLPHRALALWRAQIRVDLPATASIAPQFDLVSEPPIHVQKLLRNELLEPPDPDLRTLTVFKEIERVG